MATLTTTTARPPGVVGICGLGLVGHLASKVFQSAGYHVTAWDPVVSRHAHLPADITVLAHAPDTGGDPAFDLVVDCSGHEAAIYDACQLVRPRGEVVLTGTPWTKRTDLSAHALLSLVFHRYVVLRSGWEWELPLKPSDFRVGSVHGNLAGALHWLAAGRVAVNDLADRANPSDAQRIYSALADRSATSLTAIFDWQALG